MGKLGFDGWMRTPEMPLPDAPDSRIAGGHAPGPPFLHVHNIP
jgi:hypothetical protein